MTITIPHAPAAGVTRLQEELVERILDIARQDGLSPGQLLSEKGLAKRLNVSRTPIRTALDILARRGVVIRRPQVGVELVCLPDDSEATAGNSDGDGTLEDDIVVRIARDRDARSLDDNVSETELMQRYGVNRQIIRSVLERLAKLHVIQRKPGYGWRFLALWNASLHDESYRFRSVVEPAAIMEPNFELPSGWIEDMRSRHALVLENAWDNASSIGFFEMNAAFHEGIAAASGNRFFLEAVRQHIYLRRLTDYNWKHGLERVRANCAEHLAIIDCLEKRDMSGAAQLMREHLAITGRTVSQFADTPSSG